ncbi:MAG TPA: hypothetical protein VMB81_07325 [Candidatus Sulfotelmatobacter sp.]|nr:hypothetical protein [Candidatus Sulfotelmatobacter sp.]
MSRFWFVQKRYGYGATPTTWQGWAATLAFVALFVAIVLLVGGWPRWVLGALAIAGFAILACAKTDGGCRWRWG